MDCFLWNSILKGGVLLQDLDHARTHAHTHHIHQRTRHARDTALMYVVCVRVFSPKRRYSPTGRRPFGAVSPRIVLPKKAILPNRTASFWGSLTQDRFSKGTASVWGKRRKNLCTPKGRRSFGHDKKKPPFDCFLWNSLLKDGLLLQEINPSGTRDGSRTHTHADAHTHHTQKRSRRARDTAPGLFRTLFFT